MQEKSYLLANAKTFVLLTGCEDGESSCPRGRINSGISCIPESFVCDGIEDCIGGTDEMNCTGPSKVFIDLVPRPHPAHIYIASSIPHAILIAIRTGVGFGFGTETRFSSL